MTKVELEKYIKSKYPKESNSCEHKEFKTLKNTVAGRKGEDIISYVSALSNMNGGELIIGIKDITLEVIGIEESFDYTAENLPYRIKGNCTNLNTEGLYVEEYITTDTHQKVWILHIPKHLARKPVYAHKVAWQRSGDSIIQLTPERENSMLSESLSIETDWSTKICKNTTFDNLSIEAIDFAKEEYKTKHKSLADEVDSWSIEQFLAKAKMLKDGKITNACMLLLGEESKSYLLENINPQITWILKDNDNIEQSYEHFGLPLLLSAKKVHNKIRNFKYRYMSDNKLFPEEVDKYDNWVLYEALHNAIAHQDYELRSRINVVEFPDKVIISNAGDFLAGDIEEIIQKDVPSEFYRNDFLCKAMVEINMIDTIGSGIKRMFSIQKKRFFPMPDYLIGNQRVQVTIYGKILDERYTQFLATNSDVSLIDVIYLDKIAKKYSIDDESIKYLKSKGLIEGRKPNLHISLSVAKATEQRSDYMKLKGIEDEYIQKIILDYLKKFKTAKRVDFENILLDKISDILDIYQKKNKVKNSLQALKKDGKIRNSGKIWEMSK